MLRKAPGLLDPDASLCEEEVQPHIRPLASVTFQTKE